MESLIVTPLPVVIYNALPLVLAEELMILEFMNSKLVAIPFI